jgi:hypothetical protein
MVDLKLRERSAVEGASSVSVTDERRSCARHRAALPSLAQYDSTAGEALAISLLRFIFAGQLHGDGACYEAAHHAAETALDFPEATELVVRVTCLVRAMKCERSDEFQFLPPNCCRITRDEQSFLHALRAAIDGDAGSLCATPALLSQDQAGRRTDQALTSLARALVTSGLASGRVAAFNEEIGSKAC